MKTVLVISSFVASSRVGAGAAAFCLRRLGLDAVILPTTLMGRHPGWGTPGGGAVSVEHMEAMWSAIRDQGLVFDGILTGYMGEEPHITLAAKIIAETRLNNADSLVLVDPVMGDHGSLYIPEHRAQAVINTLLPLADIITPNLWELSYLSGQNSLTEQDIVSFCQTLQSHSIITSVPDGDHIGAIWVDHSASSQGMIAGQISHRRFERTPHGGGDCLAALVMAHRLAGDNLALSTQKSVASIFEIMKTAHQNMLKGEDDGELPLVEAQNALIQAPSLFHKYLHPEKSATL